MTRAPLASSVLLLAGLFSCTSNAPDQRAPDAGAPPATAERPPAEAPPARPAFAPPPEDAIPATPFGDVVRYGRELFVNTEQLRGKFGTNGLRCVNCHLDAGRKADSAPLWAAYPMYPAYRAKTGQVNTLEERLQGCFVYSLNGRAPASGSKELTALLTYQYWMASGAPTGVELPGRGYPKLAKPPQAPDRERGRAVYAASCAVCHGPEGQGQETNGSYVFPPLWGAGSYNWGAGMHRLDLAAAFIHANMPLSKGRSLGTQEAWDVALFINSHERPRDPRATGTLGEADRRYHAEDCVFGEVVDGQVLGAGPSRRGRPPR